MKNAMYPLYHCKKCGCFFKDKEGKQKDSLYGQQSAVIGIVCHECQKKEQA